MFYCINALLVTVLRPRIQKAYIRQAKSIHKTGERQTKHAEYSIHEGGEDSLCISLWQGVCAIMLIFAAKNINETGIMKEINLPIGGPLTIEEALADIEDSERSIEAGKGTSWNEVKEMLAEKVYSFAG